ncbi:Double Clp-N motif-containing P-loop nucleoside triphosphate hydrolases superfamily protein [Euphorbia peplus]|nr:Double Clp-N motif-containing P-loop nucleoside triphosphate hydrolases superfamily protein [Euphorbia peplus]
MRSGTCTVQQTLTAEAASVLKHSLTLARRRGHAQVTPLHVAATLLGSRTSLLKRACLKASSQSQSQSLHNYTVNHHHHPLQCRALELCFNVALNRLPTTPPPGSGGGPLIHHHNAQNPSLSNALIAALKRAQAHQRRGCIEQQQQQPLLTVKVELEQLVISILDDPSVSRVMREAGFSSTSVKSNIEEFSSSSSCSSSLFQNYSPGVGVFSSPCSPNYNPPNENPWHTHFLSYSPEKNPYFISPKLKVFGGDTSSLKEDARLVLEVFLSKKRKNIVIIGDCVSITEGVVAEIMSRFERGDVPLELKKVQLVKFQFAPVSLKFMKQEDVEMNVLQLKNKVESIGDGGVVIYMGDLKWTIEEMSGELYSPIDHLVREIGKLVSDLNGKKIWLMGSASYQTYMRCQMRQPPLEIQWGLQAVSVPSGGLGLTLHGSSIQVVETKPLIGKEKDEQEKLNCCQECTSSYEKEAQIFKSTHHKNLPPWLHPQKDELIEIRRKWNGLCQSLNHQGRNTHNFYNNNGQPLLPRNNTYPWWSTPQNNNFISDSSNSISFTESSLKHSVNSTSNFVPKFRRQQSCSTIDFNIGNGMIIQKQQAGGESPNLDSLKNTIQDNKELKLTLALGNSIFSGTEKREKWRNDLGKLLQENVPWQCESIESIVDVLAESRSNRKGTWLMVEGNDTLGKRRLALAISESVLGSSDLLLHLNLRKRENLEDSDTMMRALRTQEKIVALIEDVDFGDTKFLNFLADGFLSGKFERSESVFILTRGSGESLDHVQDSVIQMKLEVKETDRKRKAERENVSKNKIARTESEEEQEQNMENTKKNIHCFSRQSSFNSALDLNMKADEENEVKTGEISPISSDLTSDGVTPDGILEFLMKNKYVFDGKQDDLERNTREEIIWKMRKCVEEEFGEENVDRVGFKIEEKVVEEVIKGYGSYTNSKIERWVKEVFKTSLKTVKNGGEIFRGGKMEIRLCFGGGNIGNGNGIVLENGYMGTCLPKKIQVSLRD